MNIFSFYVFQTHVDLSQICFASFPKWKLWKISFVLYKETNLTRLNRLSFESFSIKVGTSRKRKCNNNVNDLMKTQRLYLIYYFHNFTLNLFTAASYVVYDVTIFLTCFLSWAIWRTTSLQSHTYRVVVPCSLSLVCLSREVTAMEIYHCIQSGH